MAVFQIITIYTRESSIFFLYKRDLINKGNPLYPTFLYLLYIDFLLFFWILTYPVVQGGAQGNVPHVPPPAPPKTPLRYPLQAAPLGG